MNKYEKIFTEKYSILNKEQKKAVDSLDGPVFVMAGPGTGKTQILTLRIANILREINDIEPENILALTFTNAAAYNMRERLAGIIGGELAYRVHISTFHSFAEEVMKKHPEYFPRFEKSRLVSPVEQIDLIEKILDSKKELVHFSKFKRRENTIKSISFSLGKIKSEALSADEFIKQADDKYHEDASDPKMFYKRAYGEFKKGDLKISELRKLDARLEKTKELAGIYSDYENALHRKNLYDFSDLILSFVSELDSDSDFQSEMQEQYHYMLVDEHQDTNDAQNSILHSLIDNPVWEGKPNIFVVGDTKQAIFRFAGASEKSYSALLGKLDSVEKVSLSQNYRSHQNILDHSYSLISKSEAHADEILLNAFFDHGGIFQYRQFQNYKMENIFVAQSIKEKIDSGVNPQEISALFRANKDGEELRHLLAVYGIPVQDFSKKNILRDPDMLKLFLLMRSVYNLSDDEVVAKSLFIDFLGFNVFSVQRIINAVKSARKEEKKKVYAFISDEKSLLSIGIPEDEVNSFLLFAESLADLKSFSENNEFLSFFSEFIRKSGFLNYVLGQKDSSIGITKIEKLFDEIKKESLGREDFSFIDFIEYLNTLKKHNISMNISSQIMSGVQLMTFHASKGLEFDYVYIIKALRKRKMGAEISLPFEDFKDGEVDDERRLLYVAITRAKRECYISSHIFDAQGKEKNESQFISEIDLMEKVDVSDWEKEHAKDVVDLFGEEDEHIASLLDHEYIKNLFMKKQLSVSALNNYMESALKYFFRNLVALPEARSHFLDFGNLMHETLESFFDSCRKENIILGRSDLQDSFEKVLESKPYYAEFKEKAWTTLDSYYAYYKEDFDVPLEDELRVSGIPFEINESENIFLSGAVDKITKDIDGNIVVWDYKTGRAYSDMDKGRKQKLKRQATFYKLLLQNYAGGRFNFKIAVFDFLEKNSKGEYERAQFEITQDDVNILIDEIKLLIDDILKGTLLEKDFRLDDGNRDLLEFLEVMKGPRTGEQNLLF